MKEGFPSCPPNETELLPKVLSPAGIPAASGVTQACR